MAPAKGWTHPNHWKVATVGTLCQLLSIAFIAAAVLVTPFFTDRRGSDKKLIKLTNMDIKCEMDYCYNSKEETNVPQLPPGVKPTHVHQVANKPGSNWLNNARALLAIGAGSNLLSLCLILLVFWPAVCCGRVLNFVLFVCRLVDFFGAPAKFIGSFFFIWYISDINENYSWWKYEGLLQLDPLPIGLVLFSYILQTLTFVCCTLATDIGAKGQLDHLALLKQQKLIESMDNVEPEEFERVSYHPLDGRSSKVLSAVAKSATTMSETHV
ncbi:hypothetical protein EGW08_004759 [Elysia chlorotica]|uniref:Uncharacterized protein n=1 Tax=Elysia chlorotica TaxID=188477 RepID=A0A3S1CAL0_ELYCH|nr:hypothetical protein EGW08_004759 [Elysia chlorotica]